MYRKTFEDGLIASEGWGAQCDNIPGPWGDIYRGSVQVDSSTSFAGSRHGNFYMPTNTGTSRVGCGLIRSKYVRERTHEYFSQAVMFPAGFDARALNDPYRAVGVSQDYQYYGYPAGGNLPIMADHAYGSPDPAVTLVAHTGECKNMTCPMHSGLLSGGGYSSRGMPPGQDGPYVIIPPDKITRGVWYQYLVHVYWSTNNDGLVEAWYRPKGGSWIHSVTPKTGFPTLSWGQDANTGTWISKESVDGRRSSAKFGYYNPNPLTAQTVHWDQVCEATTFEAAASC